MLLSGVGFGMRRLFLRLTVAFWLLFLALIISTCLNFYMKYEQNFSQIVGSIDQKTENIGDLVRADLDRILELFQIFSAVINKNYQQIVNLYDQLSDEELERIVNLEANEPGNREEDIRWLASRQAMNETNFNLLDIMNKTEVVKVSFQPDERLTEIYSHFNPEYILEQGYYLFFDNQVSDNKEADYRFYLVSPLVLDDQMMGYLKAEFVSTTNLLHDFTNSLYYIGEQTLIPYCEFCTESEANFLKTASSEEAVQLFEDKDYYTSLYTDDEHRFKILHYTGLKQIHADTFRATMTIYKILIFVSLIAIAVGFYFLFKSAIEPCYLLNDYIKRCNERDYLIPAKLNEKWRLTFINIREAYLESERLLAEKDNQSEELQLAWKRAIDASEAKTHFLTKVSHELRTPLNAIKGYAQLLRRNITENKQKSQLGIIEHSSELLLKLVNELLDFSIIEEGKLKLQKEQFNFYLVANEIEELFVIQANSKNLDFFVVIDDSIPRVLYGDSNRIKQVMINLISNALKFTERGYITVHIDLDYETATDAYISINVKDTGKGIDASKFSTIFESFTQEHNDISRVYGGTGLGLSISKQLVEAMGGKLTLESKINVGTTFTFFVPLAKVSNEENS